MCRFDGFSTACVQVNAFEDGSTVKLQIAAHIGARESVEQNFREPQLHITALDQKWCRALQHPKRNHCRSAGWIEILFLSHRINSAILLVLIFDPNQITLCLQQPKRIKWLNCCVLRTCMTVRGQTKLAVAWKKWFWTFRVAKSAFVANSAYEQHTVPWEVWWQLSWNRVNYIYQKNHVQSVANFFLSVVRLQGTSDATTRDHFRDFSQIPLDTPLSPLLPCGAHKVP